MAKLWPLRGLRKNRMLLIIYSSCLAYDRLYLESILMQSWWCIPDVIPISDGPGIAVIFEEKRYILSVLFWLASLETFLKKGQDWIHCSNVLRILLTFHLTLFAQLPLLINYWNNFFSLSILLSLWHWHSHWIDLIALIISCLESFFCQYFCIFLLVGVDRITVRRKITSMHFI